MDFVETIVFVAAGSSATMPVRSGCTRILLSEDRALQPHPALTAKRHCAAVKRHCMAADSTCRQRKAGCLSTPAACG